MWEIILSTIILYLIFMWLDHIVDKDDMDEDAGSDRATEEDA